NKLGVIISEPSWYNDSLIGFRDPFVWKKSDDEWYMILGVGFKNVGGNALIYHSKDLENWEFLDTLVSEEDSIQYKNITGIMWECPVLLQFDEGKSILLLSGDHTEPKFQQ